MGNLKKLNSSWWPLVRGLTSQDRKRLWAPQIILAKRLFSTETKKGQGMG